jgi:subtilisin family serine protease
LLQYQNSIHSLARSGFKLTSFAGDVAAGSILVSQLHDLAQHPDVTFVGGSRLLKDEDDVGLDSTEVSDPITTLRQIPSLGADAIIGVIDSGFELTHPCFQKANGETRIVAAWDQKNEDPEKLSAKVDYGIEYDRAAINQLLSRKEILVIKNNPGAGGHGTQVAGIAAGTSVPRMNFSGVAPEAELILVSYRNDNDEPIGGSAFVLDAIDFIRKQAFARKRPVVINISQGDNLGAHDGTSLLERAMDNVIKEGRVLIVNSAGNERGGHACHHARGQVDSGSNFVLPFALMVSDTHSIDGDTIDLWYRRGDRFAVALRAPDGWRSEWVNPGTSAPIQFPNGNSLQVYSEINYPTNGDNRIGVFFEKGEGWAAGTYQLILRGCQVRLGDFDAWADRPNGVTVIDFEAAQSDIATVTMPGNARQVITVGGFVHGAEPAVNKIPGALAAGSSLGPTRDGRVKPDLTAPSTQMIAPRMRAVPGPLAFDPTSGTSMAAPYVSGVIALMWSLWPQLRADEIRAALFSSARVDTFTGVTPSTSWGVGKIDAEAAYEALSDLIKKGEAAMGKTIFEFDMRPTEISEGRLAGMHIRIQVTDGEDIVISGYSEGDEYEGRLVLRKAEAKSHIATSASKPAPGPTSELMSEAEAFKVEGGDQCYINGVWYDPCPVNNPDLPTMPTKPKPKPH